MSTTHRSLNCLAMSVAGVASIFLSLANAQQSEPAISLVRPLSAETSAATSLASANKPSLNYREFASAKAGTESASEVFTFRFNRATKISSISASADFHVAGGSCVEGRMYSVGNVCSVEVNFTPHAPWRWGALPAQLLEPLLIDIPALFLLFWLMRRLGASRMAARFLLAPLFTIVAGMALEPSFPPVRACFGIALLAGSAGWLVFAPAEEPDAKKIASLNVHTADTPRRPQTRT